jgi:hypothetical protein
MSRANRIDLARRAGSSSHEDIPGSCESQLDLSMAIQSQGGRTCAFARLEAVSVASRSRHFRHLKKGSLREQPRHQNFSCVAPAISDPPTRRDYFRLLAQFALMLSLLGSAFEVYAASQTIRVSEDTRLTLGDQETLLKDGALGLRYMPDQGVGVIENAPGRVRLLFAATYASHLVEGTDIKNLKSAHKILRLGGRREFDNGDAAVCSVVQSKDKLYAIYHAEDHEGMGEVKSGGNAPSSRN